MTVAAKQFPLVPLERPVGLISTLKTELRVHRKIEEMRQKSENFREKYPGVKNLSLMIEDIRTQTDHWLIYELGGKSFHHELFMIEPDVIGD